ncbi:MAG: hypothetical protein JXP73_08065 [Deltaproteobacteria bacterium]|nr:hypothetical protein [Deltaproteobacteria bacterium]
MHVQAQLLSALTMLAVPLPLGLGAAPAQAEPPAASPAAAGSAASESPTTAAPTEPAPAPDATAPPAAPTAAPPNAQPAPTPYYPAPAYYPPPGAYPPGYAPPPGAYPPGYAPPPGSYPPGYYPPPGYAPPGYYAPRPAGPLPGYHEHDGFYMRLGLGLGYLRMSDSHMGVNETMSGWGPALDMAFGGAVARNLLLFGELSVSATSEPTWQSGNTSNTMTSTNLNLVGMGAGAAYYLDPLNLYFGGSLGLAQVTISSDANAEDENDELTDFGFSGKLMVGKEWWVSADWGLGAATMLQFASMKMKNYDNRMSAVGLTLLFSATYN